MSGIADPKLEKYAARHSTGTGYSALVMAEALPKNGKILTCDINPKTTLIAKKYWTKVLTGKKYS